MNSMIDAQNDAAALATIAPEEVYGGFHAPVDDDIIVVDDDGPTADDVAPPDYDGPQDDGHIYPDDGDYDPSSDFWGDWRGVCYSKIGAKYTLVLRLFSRGGRGVPPYL